MGKQFDSNNLVTGVVTGTGAAINVSVGFIPRRVKVYNPNDAGALYPIIEWVKGMAAGKGFKYTKIADSGATGGLSSTYIAANGISEYAGSSSAAQGFTIGADADMNVAGEDIIFEAWR